MKKNFITSISGIFCLLAAATSTFYIDVTREKEAKLLNFTAQATEPMGWGVISRDITIEDDVHMTTLNAYGVVSAPNSKVFEGNGRIDKDDLPLESGKRYHIVYKERLSNALGLTTGGERVVRVTPLP